MGEIVMQIAATAALGLIAWNLDLIARDHRRIREIVGDIRSMLHRKE